MNEVKTLKQGNNNIFPRTKSSAVFNEDGISLDELLADIIGEHLKGKKISVMGDSYSAYAGTIPSGNLAYYTGGNSGVTSPNQMWWKVMCERLGATPAIINGWSGSCVTVGVKTDEIEASAVSRCTNLGTGENTPDIIIVAMGVNDYSYDAPMGTYDGITALNDDTATFRTAYATMLKRIQTNYPNALIVCLTPWFNQRGTDNGATYVNSLGLTQQKYAEAIIDIAHLMQCPVIDAMRIGFTRHNYYPTFCVDNITKPTHPNAAGQRVMGLTIASELKRICVGYQKHELS